MTEALLLVIDAKGSYSLDEIRWGETFADVTPAPPLATTELIGSGEQWDFFRGTAEPSPFPELAWTTGRFDDTAWETAQEGFGYGSHVETGIFYYRGHLKPLNGGGPNHNAVDAAIAASLEADDDSQDALFEELSNAEG